jgi:mycoredoxin-dependent peroxiredoxin
VLSAGDPVITVGDDAPDVLLQDQHGRSQSLAARRGSRQVLLVFFPFAFTGVCSGELRELSDNAAAIASFGADVLAVSCDAVPALRAFADSQQLEIPLLSDFWPHGEVASSYGAFDATNGIAGRSSFLIDRDGVVRWTTSTAVQQPRPISAYLHALAAF